MRAHLNLDLDSNTVHNINIYRFWHRWLDNSHDSSHTIVHYITVLYHSPEHPVQHYEHPENRQLCSHRFKVQDPSLPVLSQYITK